MLKIKLKPTGKIHQRSFRIVVSPDRSKSNGKFIDDLGFYTPTTKTLEINKDKMAQWLKNGAQLTTGVDKLLNPDKFPRKKKKTNPSPLDKLGESPLDRGDSKQEIKTEEPKEEIKEEVVEKIEKVEEVK